MGNTNGRGLKEIWKWMEAEKHYEIHVYRAVKVRGMAGVDG